MHNSEHSDYTRRSGAANLGQTQPHRSMHPVSPPEPPSGGITQQAPPARQPLPKKTRRKRRRSRRTSCLGCLLRIVLAGVLFAAAFGTLLVSLYWFAAPPRTNILILGLDARPGEGMATRTDTVILVTVDPEQPYVGMLSIPRDLYVNIPGYGMDRINVAHVLGESEAPGRGPVLAAETVEQNFLVPVDRTLRLNLEGFVAIVDAAGGVTIDVESYFIDYEYPTADYGTMVVEFYPGEQHMDGARALQYARVRHGASDFERIARQQQVLEGLARQLLRPANWGRLPAVYAAFAGHVDTDLSLLDAILLAPAVLWVGPNGIDHRILDRDMAVGTTTAQGAAVLEPQWAVIQPMLDEMFRK